MASDRRAEALQAGLERWPGARSMAKPPGRDGEYMFGVRRSEDKKRRSRKVGLAFFVERVLCEKSSIEHPCTRLPSPGVVGRARLDSSPFKLRRTNRPCAKEQSIPSRY